MFETWRPIPGWDGYEVSDQGGVKTLKYGNARPLAVDVDRGYRRVRLFEDGRAHRRGIHQLVALAFIGPRPDGHEVRHLDGNGSNNVPSNLGYATSSVNQIDKVRHGTHNMARKTHCKRGHQLDGENVALITLTTRSIARRCRACQREKAAERRRQQVAS